jgi:hypothetical protein
MVVQYWRTTEQLIAYARNASNQHAHPWTKVMKKSRETADYGVWHEMYIVKEGNYETVYVNMPPLLLGNCLETEIIPIQGKNNTAAGRAGLSDGTDYPEEVTGKLE